LVVGGKFIHVQTVTHRIPRCLVSCHEPGTQEIIVTVCEHFQVTKEQMAVSRRGSDNLPRDVILFLVRLLTRETMPEVGKNLGIGTYSTAGSVIERMEQHPSEASGRYPKNTEQKPRADLTPFQTWVSDRVDGY
jgi:hypothetical protein